MLNKLTVRSVVVIILVVGAFVLAIADHDFRPTFGDLAKVGVGGYLGQLLPEANKRGDSFNQFAPPPPQQPQPPLQINSHNKPKQVRPTQPLTPFSSLRPHGTQTRKLYGQMVRLLQGDSEAVNRLINNQKAKNPDKSEEWIYEKVLFDVTRDRH